MISISARREKLEPSYQFYILMRQCESLHPLKPWATFTQCKWQNHAFINVYSDKVIVAEGLKPESLVWTANTLTKEACDYKLHETKQKMLFLIS